MVMCFFFFKQKTAYEMRISDWSSDVCSSDLHREAVDESAEKQERHQDQQQQHMLWQIEAAGPLGDFDRQPAGGERHAEQSGADDQAENRTGDRKSVVSGKSVSVRVDLGGSRSIKKKTMHKNNKNKKQS